MLELIKIFTRPLTFLFDGLSAVLSMSIRKKYRLAKFPFTRSHFIFRPLYYKYFDSYVDDYNYPKIAPDLIRKPEETDFEETFSKNFA